MKGYTIEEIAKIIRGKFLQKAETPRIEHLVLDSRKLSYTHQSVFFAIKGQRRNGHHFIRELHEKGVKNFVVSEEITLPPHSNVIKVKDTVTALQSLAAHHRKQFNVPVIGITGSNGKTIVKEWLSQLLSPDYSIVKSPKSYNSQIGVPLSIWPMDDFHDLALFEAGISQPDEMANLAKVIQPTIGIFTNIGNAHSEGFLNIRQKINEKLKLFMNAEVIIFCRDYIDINECIAAARAQMKKADVEFDGFKTFAWSKQNRETEGETSAQHVWVKKIEKNTDTTFITLDHKGQTYEFSIAFIDDASIENAIHCWMLLFYLKVNPEVIRQRMLDLHAVAMRLEMKDAVNNCSLINDSYNSDLNSLGIALDFLMQQKQHPKKTVVLSDILQSGLNDLKLYNDVSELLQSKSVNRLIGIGPAISGQKNVFEKNGAFASSFYSSTDEFLSTLDADSFSDETILLKGARRFEFERIGKRLEQKAHETVLEIDLNALLHNLSVYQSLLRPETKTMVMVKAFSYGSGSFEVANALQFHKTDYLAVAYADEGAELRKAGITTAVMVMNPEPQSFDALIHYHLEPELYSVRLMKQFLHALEPQAHRYPDGYPVHLEMETGMNRLGFSADDLDEMISLLVTNKKLVVKSVFTHLAASEDASLDHYSHLQLQRFAAMASQVQQKLGYPFLRHALNSAGIVRFPDAHFDMIRLGIGLYGFDSTSLLQSKLKNVSTLKTTISQIKKIKAGETIGYGRMGMAHHDLTIATVGIGYADGLNRSLGRGQGKMLVKNQLAPIVGNICMDMAMIDISHIHGCEEGDEVMVFGKELPVQQVAEWAGTIPYEIVSTISRRVKRVYFQE
jgi:alanine racemase